MKITPLVASRFRADGGAMFGLVPKPIWSKCIDANERNTIPQNANALLVHLDDGRIGLVDSGCGDPAVFPDKACDLHGMTRDWPLRDALEEHAVPFDAIDFVVLTHLHWDHAGGLATAGTPCFPRAEIVLHQQEFDDATGGDPLLYKSYPPETIAPLREGLQLRRVEGEDTEIFPGIRLRRTGGHTRGHCSVTFNPVRIDHPHAGPEELRAVFAGDVCPTRHHLRMVFQTAYDTFPLDTRAWKRQELPDLEQTGTWLFFCHDPEVFAARLAPDERHEFVTNEILEISK